MTERRPLVIVGNKKTELPAGDTLPGGGSGSLPYVDSVQQTSTLTRSATGFLTFMTFEPVIPVDGDYMLHFQYKWRHEKKDAQHRVRIDMDASEIDEMRAYQYMGGKEENSARVQTHLASFPISLLAIDTPSFTAEFASGKSGDTSYLYERQMWLEQLT